MLPLEVNKYHREMRDDDVYDYMSIEFDYKEMLFTHKYDLQAWFKDGTIVYKMFREGNFFDETKLIYTKQILANELKMEMLEEELRCWFRYERNITNVTLIEDDLKHWKDVKLLDDFSLASTTDKTSKMDYKIISIIDTPARGGTRHITGKNNLEEEYSFSVSNDELDYNYLYTSSHYIESITKKENL